MPIRFVNAYSRLGQAAPVLDDLSAALAGDISEPAIFTGAISPRLNDLTSALTGQYVLDSSVVGSVSAALSGVGGLMTGSVVVNPLYPPPVINLVLL